ncbi:YsnF/AvaK domain-containing protein [Larkinella sp. VNQ87]|uniref:YsnF/AvaK domain-containing protein n=1 Tax=Larkinella sp. VNQ87 TaxID=3400921 RepID=UPI003C0E5C25
MAQTVIGMFDNETEARQAVEQLVSRGFTHDDIDLSVQNTTETERAYRSDDDDNDSFSDSIGNFFGSLFGSNDEADRYSQVARRLRSLVTVHTQSVEEAERAADILDDAGAVDVDERASQYGYTSGTNATTGAAYPATDRLTTDTDYTVGTDQTVRDTDRTYDLPDTTRTDADRSIPIIEENLQVGKREVTTGGARIRSRIVERPIEETLRLRHERVNVERTPVDRPATAADLANFQESEIELTERAEVPVVNKEARVVEEVSLNKEIEERDETIRDSVRRTEVDVDNLTDDPLRNRTDDPLRDRTL